MQQTFQWSVGKGQARKALNLSISLHLYIKSFTFQTPSHHQQYMQWSSSALGQCKNRTLVSEKHKESVSGKKNDGVIYQESKRYFSRLVFIAAKWKRTTV